MNRWQDIILDVRLRGARRSGALADGLPASSHMGLYYTVSAIMMDNRSQNVPQPRLNAHKWDLASDSDNCPFPSRWESKWSCCQGANLPGSLGGQNKGVEDGEQRCIQAVRPPWALYRGLRAAEGAGGLC